VQGEDPRSFEAVLVLTWKPNRLYRVYALPGELVVIYVGSGEELTTALAHSFGLIGGLVAGALRGLRKSPPDEWRDWTRIDQIVAEHKHSFRTPVAELSNIRIEASSVRSTLSIGPHVGMLLFTHNNSKMRFCFRKIEDMKVAVESVPAVLGHQVAVNAEWDDRKQSFVKKAHA
jgi:hypothetical protein